MRDARKDSQIRQQVFSLLGSPQNCQGNDQEQGAEPTQPIARTQAWVEANRKTGTSIARSFAAMQWFTREVWPNLFASIVWSLPTWAFIFWRFARRFVKEREEILHRLDEMHKNMNEQHRATHREHTEIQEEVHRAPPPPPRRSRS